MVHALYCSNDLVISLQSFLVVMNLFSVFGNGWKQEDKVQNTSWLRTKVKFLTLPIISILTRYFVSECHCKLDSASHKKGDPYVTGHQTTLYYQWIMPISVWYGMSFHPFPQNCPTLCNLFWQRWKSKGFIWDPLMRAALRMVANFIPSTPPHPY